MQQLAGWVQEETGGDLFSIQVAEPYPSDWDECLDRANEEQGSNARPTLTGQVENLDQYDTVFLGYPNWWYGVPMALLTFLEEKISLEKKSTCSALMALEAWLGAYRLLRRRHPMQSFQKISLIVMKKKHRQRR